MRLEGSKRKVKRMMESQCPMINHNGKECLKRKKKYIYIYVYINESLCYVAEINTL